MTVMPRPSRNLAIFMVSRPIFHIVDGPVIGGGVVHANAGTRPSAQAPKEGGLSGTKRCGGVSIGGMYESFPQRSGLSYSEDLNSLLFLQRRRSRKQDVIFQMDMLVQISFELDQRGEKRPVRVTRFIWNVIVEREMAHLRERPAGAFVLVLHARDRVLDRTRRSRLATRFEVRDRRKQDHLLLHQVRIQLLFEGFEHLVHLG